jgi:hypothetical protein
MKAGHWFVLLLALAALGWWNFGHPGYETPAQREARVQAQAEAAEAAKPKLYRWHDAQGRLQLTDTPPPHGRKYELVDLEAQENVNVIPMSEGTGSQETKPGTEAKH